MKNELDTLTLRPPRSMQVEERGTPLKLTPESVAVRDQLRAKMVRVQNADISLDLPYVVKNTLLHGEMSVLYGPSNVGKSCLVVDLARAICTGEDWHGHRTRQGIVLYLAA